VKSQVARLVGIRRPPHFRQQLSLGDQLPRMAKSTVPVAAIPFFVSRTSPPTSSRTRCAARSTGCACRSGPSNMPHPARSRRARATARIRAISSSMPKGFRDVVVSTGVQRRRPCRSPPIRPDSTMIGALLQPTETLDDLDSVQVRQAEVEQHHVRRVLGGEHQRLGPRCRPRATSYLRARRLMDSGPGRSAARRRPAAPASDQSVA